MMLSRLRTLVRFAIVSVAVATVLLFAFTASSNPTSATKSSINGPSSLALFKDTYLFVVESGNYHVRVLRVDLKKGTITTAAGNGADCCYKEGAPATQVGFDWIPSIAVDSAGNLFIADDQYVRKVSAKDGLIITVAGSARDSVVAGSGALPTSFKLIQGLAVDTDDNLFLSDGSQIFKMDVQTGRISKVAGNGQYGFSGDGGPAVDASFRFLGSIALDSTGNLFVADTDNCRIRRVERTTGIIETVAQSGGIEQNCPPPPNGNSWVLSADDPVVDAQGHVYFTEPTVGRVAMASAIPDHPEIVAGTGEQGFSGIGGRATSAKLHSPSGLAVDSSSNLFIADYVNNRIFRVDSKTKRITSAAGNGLPHRLDVEM